MPLEFVSIIVSVAALIVSSIMLVFVYREQRLRLRPQAILISLEVKFKKIDLLLKY
jgi:hypothetical protein